MINAADHDDLEEAIYVHRTFFFNLRKVCKTKRDGE